MIATALPTTTFLEIDHISRVLLASIPAPGPPIRKFVRFSVKQKNVLSALHERGSIKQTYHSEQAATDFLRTVYSAKTVALDGTSPFRLSLGPRGHPSTSRTAANVRARSVGRRFPWTEGERPMRASQDEGVR